MSTIPITKLYDMLSVKLGREAADQLINYLKQEVKLEMKNKSETLATKDDLHKTKIDFVKWLIGFWVTLVLLILGLYLRS